MKFKVSSVILILMSSAAAMNVQANGGTITFTGEVVDNTCEVSIDGSADPTITLPSVSEKSLAAADDVAGRTNFTMQLSNCSGAKNNVSAFFESGSTVEPVSGTLKNTETVTPADNVQLQLIDSDGEPIQAGSGSQIAGNEKATITNGAATLNYAVQYIATGQSTPGLVKSTVVYSLSYN